MNYNENLNKARVRYYSSEYENIIPFIYIAGRMTGTINNFSVTAINDKTPLYSYIIAAAAVSGREIMSTKVVMSSFDNTILYFDTCNKKKNCWIGLNFIRHLCDSTGEGNLNFFCLDEIQDTSPEGKLKFIENTIASYSNIGFIVIDGIQNLIKNNDDHAKTDEIISKLRRWSSDNGTHIHATIHLDSNLNAFFGNKITANAETAIRFIKKDDYIEFIPIKCNNKSFGQIIYCLDDKKHLDKMYLIEKLLF